MIKIQIGKRIIYLHGFCGDNSWFRLYYDFYGKGESRIIEILKFEVEICYNKDNH